MFKQTLSCCMFVSFVLPVFGMEIEISNKEKLKNAHNLALTELIDEDAQKILTHELEQEHPSHKNLYKNVASIPWIEHLDNKRNFSKSQREEILADALMLTLNEFDSDSKSKHDSMPCMNLTDLQSCYLEKIQYIPVALHKTIKAQILCTLGFNYCNHLAQSRLNEITPQVRNLLKCGPTVGLCCWVLDKHPGLKFTDFKKKTKLISVSQKIEEMITQSFSVTQKTLYDFINDQVPLHTSRITELLNPEILEQQNLCSSNMKKILTNDIKNYDKQLVKNTKDLLDTHDDNKQLDTMALFLKNHIETLPEPEKLLNDGIDKEVIKQQLTNNLQRCVTQSNQLFKKYIQKDNPLSNKNSEFRVMKNARKNRDIQILFDTTVVQTIGAGLATINKFHCSKMATTRYRYFPQPLNDMYWSYNIIENTKEKCNTSFKLYSEKKASSQSYKNELIKFEETISESLKNIEHNLNKIENNQYQKLTKMISSEIVTHYARLLTNEVKTLFPSELKKH